jgi:ubiquinone/menaquinone biosynthesis C-methylase UbiE
MVIRRKNFYMPEAMRTASSVTKKFINPLFIIAQLKIPEGSVVADFGCGAGYFSIPLSQAIGKEGKLYALDILDQALEVVKSRAKLLGLSNVVTKRTNLEMKKGSGLEKESVDWVVLKDVLFQNKSKEKIIQETSRVLKPSGKALIGEWNDRELAIGPEKEMRVSSEELIELLKRNNLKVEKVVDAGHFHYAMVVAK